MAFDKTTIVTGGAGFIGSHLVELLLEKGHSVLVLDNFISGRPENLAHLKDNPNLKLVQIDVSEFDKIKEYFKRIDWVFHLAALANIVPSVSEPLRYFKNNIDATISVLEASKQAGSVKKFIYAASSTSYGITKTFPTPETAPIKPQYPYALTKHIGEEIALHYSQVYKLPVISLRLFNVYGLRSRTSSVYGAMFGIFLAQKLAGKPFTVCGDGNQTRDFTFVKDAARAFLVAAESEINGEIFNVGSGNTYSVNQVVKFLKGPIVYIPKRPGEPDCTFGDISKIKKQLGWKPGVSLEEGVKILLENIDYWKTAPVWTPESIAKATKEWFRVLGG